MQALTEKEPPCSDCAIACTFEVLTLLDAGCQAIVGSVSPGVSVL